MKPPYVERARRPTASASSLSSSGANKFLTELGHDSFQRLLQLLLRPHLDASVKTRVQGRSAVNFRPGQAIMEAYPLSRYTTHRGKKIKKNVRRVREKRRCERPPRNTTLGAWRNKPQLSLRTRLLPGTARAPVAILSAERYFRILAEVAGKAVVMIRGCYSNKLSACNEYTTIHSHFVGWMTDVSLYSCCASNCPMLRSYFTPFDGDWHVTSVSGP